MSPNYLTRRMKLLRSMKRASVDGLLISGIANVRYLTGFTGDSSWLFLNASDCILLSDTRYETQLATECPDLDVEIRDSGSTIIDVAAKVFEKSQCRRPGIEADHLTVAQHCSLANKTTTAELIATSGLVERLREIKDKWELEQIRTAIEYAQRGIGVVRSSLRSDQTETELRYLLEAAMRSFGASGTAFEPIVGVGPTAALPHAHAGTRQVAEHPVLLIDWGAATQTGYRSDLTRVFITGRPTKQIELVYKTVIAAQQAAIKAIRPGVKCADVDKIARGLIERKGYGKYFGHGLGHGFGLEIHESVRLNPISEREFETGMVVTVEPGIYLPGKFGIRIEDNILVTPEGNEVLSNLEREFDQAIVPILA
ncbi:MAG: Xaa-Pro peptidase family protein [Planctomycetaceae bacterium]